jgi:dipeptidyl aminopeptidase/acylaminoacyl peptidase
VFCLTAPRGEYGQAIVELPADAVEPEVVYRGEPGIDRIVVSFDGERIVFRRQEAGDSQAPGDSDLWVLTVATGETNRLTMRAGEEHSPCWSEEGEQVFFLAKRSPEEETSVQGIFSVPSRGGPTELVTERFEQEIFELVTAANSNRLFAIAARGEQRGFYRIRARGGKATALIPPATICSALAVHRKGEKAFFVYEGPGGSPEIASWTFPDEEAEYLTDFTADPPMRAAAESFDPYEAEETRGDR